MALSSCPKCGHDSFEMVEVQPGNWRFKIMFVQCKACGAVVGTMDYFNLSTLIHEMEERVELIISKLEDLEYEVGNKKQPY